MRKQGIVAMVALLMVSVVACGKAREDRPTEQELSLDRAIVVQYDANAQPVRCWKIRGRNIVLKAGAGVVSWGHANDSFFRDEAFISGNVGVEYIRDGQTIEHAAETLGVKLESCLVRDGMNGSTGSPVANE